MQVFTEEGKLPIKAWVDGVQLEDAAFKQLKNIAGLPFIHKHVAVMPDVHWGMGATVGSVIATKGAIIPAAVGVDIGCGMMAVRTTLKASNLPDNLHALRLAIESRIPHGRSDNGGVNDIGAWSNVSELHAVELQTQMMTLQKIVDKHPKLQQAATRAPYHAGTLGTGNHFVEICLDENQSVWIMLHSGSRGIGNRIGSYFIDLAKKDMQRWFINLPDADLAYIPNGSDLFNDYCNAVHWAQGFAMTNRIFMMDAAIDAMRSIILKPFTCDCEAVNCHHNYVSWYTQHRHNQFPAESITGLAHPLRMLFYQHLPVNILPHEHLGVCGCCLLVLKGSLCFSGGFKF